MFSIIVYARNREIDILDTHREITRALLQSAAKDSDFEIILVDDQSKDSTYEVMLSIQATATNIKVLRTGSESGINAAIMEGVREAKGESVFAIPGHNMFHSEQLLKIMENMSPNGVVLGYRNNLFVSRPPLKFIGSRLLLHFYRILVFGDVIDVHGLNSYPKKLLLDVAKYPLGHGFHMIPVTLAIAKQLRINQVPIQVSPHHKHRSSKRLSDNWPSLNAIKEVIGQLMTCRKIKREYLN